MQSPTLYLQSRNPQGKPCKPKFSSQGWRSPISFISILSASIIHLAWKCLFATGLGFTWFPTCYPFSQFLGFFNRTSVNILRERPSVFKVPHSLSHETLWTTPSPSFPPTVSSLTFISSSPAVSRDSLPQINLHCSNHASQIFIQKNENTLIRTSVITFDVFTIWNMLSFSNPTHYSHHIKPCAFFSKALHYPFPLFKQGFSTKR